MKKNAILAILAKIALKNDNKAAFIAAIALKNIAKDKGKSINKRKKIYFIFCIIF